MKKYLIFILALFVFSCNENKKENKQVIEYNIDCTTSISMEYVLAVWGDLWYNSGTIKVNPEVSELKIYMCFEAGYNMRDNKIAYVRVLKEGPVFSDVLYS